MQLWPGDKSHFQCECSATLLRPLQQAELQQRLFPSFLYFTAKIPTEVMNYIEDPPQIWKPLLSLL